MHKSLGITVVRCIKAILIAKLKQLIVCITKFYEILVGWASYPPSICKLEDLFKYLVCEQKTLFQALEATAEQIAIEIEDITDANIYLNPTFVKLYSYTLKKLQTAGVL